jgi:hypothetical protein
MHWLEHVIGTVEKIEWNMPSDLSLQTKQMYVRFEVFTAVTMKNDVFWDVTPCGSCKNLLFRGV